MSGYENERELLQYIAERTKIDPKAIALVLKHEQAFLSRAAGKGGGEVEIDGDELIDYVLSRRDVRLNELQVEEILEAELVYMESRG